VESIRHRAGGQDSEEAEGTDGSVRIEPGLLVRETVWAFAVWYVILWAAGPLRGTFLDLALVPWSDLWSGWVAAVWAVPGAFGA